MLYIKAMKHDGTYQLLEAEGYVEFIKVNKPEIEVFGVELVYSYFDNFSELQQGRHWLEGDTYIMNESGVTISKYKYNPLEVYTGERSNEELDWFANLAKVKGNKESCGNQDGVVK